LGYKPNDELPVSMILLDEKDVIGRSAELPEISEIRLRTCARSRENQIAGPKFLDLES
jgi:hypothetical protein